MRIKQGCRGLTGGAGMATMSSLEVQTARTFPENQQCLNIEQSSSPLSNEAFFKDSMLWLTLCHQFEPSLILIQMFA